jgi:hypothetical protein
MTPSKIPKELLFVTPGCDPDKVISIMKTLTEEKSLGSNRKKGFYSSYPQWAAMNNLQQSNSLAFFHKLESHTQTLVLNEAKKQQYNGTTTSSSSYPSSDKTKSTPVSKDDLARIWQMLLMHGVILLKFIWITRTFASKQTHSL